MKICEDTRNKPDKHDLKHAGWQAHGDQIFRCALPCGDYALPPAVAVDTKRSMSEIAANIGGAEHERFKRELIRARDMGTKLYILVENTDGITDLSGVAGWVNPRLSLSPKAITGARLEKAMRTLEERYGCSFLFCRPEDAACAVYKILERGI